MNHSVRAVKSLTYAPSEVRGVCESEPHGEVHVLASPNGVASETVCQYRWMSSDVNRE